MAGAAGVAGAAGAAGAAKRKPKTAKVPRKEGATTVTDTSGTAAEGTTVAVKVGANHGSFSLEKLGTAFPPLPGGVPGKTEEKKKQAGYARDFKKYSRDDMIKLIKGLKEVSRPEQMVSDCPVVLPKGNFELETDKPVPPPLMMK